jgi:hypothetical protein
MKSLVILATTVFAVSAFAQKNKTSSSASTSSYSTSSSYTQAEIIGTAGMVASAFNLGVQYNKLATNELGMGGFFSFQSSKEKNNAVIVNQVMSFGGQMKASLVRNSAYEAYLSPGFGLHMIKDGADPSSASGKSDVTWLGPTLRIGVLRTISPTMRIGLERNEIWNWLDDKLTSNSAAVYSAALSIEM